VVISVVDLYEWVRAELPKSPRLQREVEEVRARAGKHRHMKWAEVERLIATREPGHYEAARHAARVRKLTGKLALDRDHDAELVHELIRAPEGCCALPARPGLRGPPGPSGHVASGMAADFVGLASFGGGATANQQLRYRYRASLSTAVAAGPCFKCNAGERLPGQKVCAVCASASARVAEPRPPVIVPLHEIFPEEP
jgi:hypothetical protein